MVTPLDLMQAALVISLAPWNAWKVQFALAYGERYPNWWLTAIASHPDIPAIGGC